MNNGDIVEIDDSIYIYLEDSFYDINGGGVLDHKNYQVEVLMNVGPAIELFFNKKISDIEDRLNAIKNVLE